MYAIQYALTIRSKNVATSVELFLQSVPSLLDLINKNSQGLLRHAVGLECIYIIHSDMKSICVDFMFCDNEKFIRSFIFKLLEHCKKRKLASECDDHNYAKGPSGTKQKPEHDEHKIKDGSQDALSEMQQDKEMLVMSDMSFVNRRLV
ncbi:hypothetical protein PoB_005131700 [Plakobranchus ocellatus]|uniref:Uncharacterized protein n=1 Tax=Plakobranchus ocellatus TaxID=259542 RepID=A0AAV4C0K0_9GAST|nr:hypothetical protein PoB_005131700 [Plakobranchus ocellatus]